MPKLRTSLRTVAALALVAFSLTGCMKLDLDLTVNSDDTLDGTVVLALDKSVLKMSGKDPEQAFANAESGMSDLPEGSRTEVYDDGKYYGKKIVYDDLPLADFNSGKPGAPSLTHADGKFVFTADLGTGVADLGRQAELMRPFLSGIRITFAVTFPGKVVEHDSRAVADGRTVRWDLQIGEDNKLRAVAEDSSFPWPVVAVVGGALGLLVIVGIVVLAVWLSRRQRAAQAALDSAPAYPAAVPAPDTVAAAPAYPPTQAYPTVPGEAPHQP
ncbi:hypothetical protein CS0771_75690 [Catellatospora sp. IY07-71]|uniref:LppM family (lipo)protein n=1 Tax=Catellatospora sp. IY07-71 TaxID=2728827 RepID=UPI001BB345A2|nr:DUF3153 domain-containing protein [Catellatospora sp. IY07-71]BCJ78025.1 hypothetical protein CS0771_75690 [Catellatospora sp. IY07-71]